MIRALLLGLGGLTLAGAGFAQDLDAGRQVAGQCRTCHGLDGMAQIPVAPNIGGAPECYLVDHLMKFRSGARENEMISVVAANLSDQQIRDVAAWYAAHRASATLPDGAAAADAPAGCVACHGADGISRMPNVPNIAGANSVYIETQLKAFSSGQRENAIMGPIASDLGAVEMRAIADWYAAIDLAIAPPE